MYKAKLMDARIAFNQQPMVPYMGAPLPPTVAFPGGQVRRWDGQEREAGCWVLVARTTSPWCLLKDLISRLPNPIV